MKQTLPRIVIVLNFFTLILLSGPFNFIQAQDAKEYLRRAQVLRRAVQRCEDRVRSGELTACNVDAGFDVNRTLSMQEAVKLAGDYEERARRMELDSERSRCLDVRERYLRDKIAVERMQKTIQMGQEELEGWTRKNEEAQYAALKSALNLLLDGGLAYIAESTQALNGLKGAYKSYETKLKRRNGRIDPQKQARLLELDTRIREMSAAVSKAK